MDSDAERRSLHNKDSNEVSDNTENDELSDEEITLKSAKVEKSLLNSVPGLVYVSFLPPKMTPLHLKQIFSKYGEIGRIYLQPDRKSLKSGKVKHSFNQGKFSEGWIEFANKKLAKRIVNTFHSTLIVDGKKGMFADHTWNLKYLHRFRWTHLTERLRHEQQNYKQRMRIETSQARKETEVFSANLETSRKISAIKERRLKQGKRWIEKNRPKNFKQRKTVEELRLEKHQKQTLPQDAAEPSTEVVQRMKVLTNIFGT